MTDHDYIKDSLEIENMLSLSEERMKHTENVVKKSMEMADEYGGDKDKLIIAALAHDRFRDVDDQVLEVLTDRYHITDEKNKTNNALAHGPIAAEYMKDKYGIDDKEVLDSIRYHTTGRKGMELNEKILFLADAIEKDREYPGVDKIRTEAEKGLNQGIRMSLMNTIEHLKDKNKPIDSDTIEALNDINDQINGSK